MPPLNRQRAAQGRAGAGTRVMSARGRSARGGHQISASWPLTIRILCGPRSWLSRCHDLA